MPRLATIVLALGLAALGQASELELVANGGFELPLDDGWTLDASDDSVLVWTATDLDHDLDTELAMRIEWGCHGAEVWQIVPLPTLDVQVTARLRAIASAHASSYAACGLRVEYLDEDGVMLGRTVCLDHGGFSPWTTTARTRLEPLWDDIWHDVVVDVPQQLTLLPAVAPERVARLKVVVFVESLDC